MAQQPLENIWQAEARIRSFAGRILRVFGAGLLTVLPLGGTLIILALLGTWAYEWVGPGSRIGSFLVSIGLGVGKSETLRYLVGIGMICSVIMLIGLLTEMGFKKGFNNISDKIAKRIPLVKTIYETLRNFISLFSKHSAAEHSGMRPVWCNFGTDRAILALGLLATPNAMLIEGKSYYSVIIPTAPVPIGGGLFLWRPQKFKLPKK